jgi:hypothetical protein
MMYSRDLLVVGSIWRHLKRGTTYKIVSVETCATNDRDGELSVTYKSIEGPSYNRYREINGFLDGRFEPISKGELMETTNRELVVALAKLLVVIENMYEDGVADLMNSRAYIEARDMMARRLGQN